MRLLCGRERQQRRVGDGAADGLLGRGGRVACLMRRRAADGERSRRRRRALRAWRRREEEGCVAPLLEDSRERIG